MKRRVLFWGVSCCLVLAVGGCAKTEVVKKDEAITAAPKAAAVKQEAKSEPVEDQTNKKQSAKEMTPKESLEQVSPLQDSARLTAEMQRIYFNFDSATLSSSAREALMKNASLLKDSPGKVTIEGHCDERGSDEYNLALGDRRAKAAMKYLTTLGVPADRLSTISYGKEKPVNPGHDEDAWAKNRRDEFVVNR